APGGEVSGKKASPVNTGEAKPPSGEVSGKKASPVNTGEAEPPAGKYLERKPPRQLPVRQSPG
ncbi:MAG: hypothetical protein IKW95_04835, partial [Lachnospiraceae bacterium]|nr:hypothetical protein [Lachnospiraceae bacterium]